MSRISYKGTNRGEGVNSSFSDENGFPRDTGRGKRRVKRETGGSFRDWGRARKKDRKG